MLHTQVLEHRESYNYPPITTNPSTTICRENRISDTCYDVNFEEQYGVLWTTLKSDSPGKFTRDVLYQLRQLQIDLEGRIRQEIANEQLNRTRYHVVSSRIPNVFNLGGDLKFFKECIAKCDREGLKKYATDCIDLVYANSISYNLPVTTIALVQGTALGGGFEAALSNNVIVAEEQCKMGLPEVTFNMFPGMGALQLLSRRIPPAQAEKLILSGRTYSAGELHQMGLVDVLAPEGKGEEAVWDYIKNVDENTHGRNALLRAARVTNSLDYDELLRVVDIWVDTAFGLSQRDLKVMDYIVRAQQRLGH